MFRLAAATLALSASFACAVDADPAKLLPTTEQIARAESLVRKLDSEIYAERNKASRDLEEMGRAALPVINRALAETGSAEVRSRCEALRPAMAHEDLQVRLEAFNADVDARYDHNLPGWEPFAKTVGAGPACRKLFSQMMELEGNARLLAAVKGPKDELIRVVVVRRTELYNRTFNRERFVGANGIVSVKQQTPPTPSEIATQLFIESQVGTVSDRRTLPLMQYVMTQPAIREAVLDAAKGEPLRKLVVTWCETRTEVNEIFSAMSIASTYDMKELSASKLAQKVLDGAIGNVYQRAQAITILAKSGTREHIPILEKLLDDKTVCYSAAIFVDGAQKKVEIQIRDVALAMAILLKDEKIEDYSMGTVRPVSSAQKYSYYLYHFVNDEKREAGLKKWEENRKK